MDRVRILYFESSSGYGGSSRCLLEWVKKLAKNEYHSLVVYHDNGPAINKIKSLPIQSIRLPSFTKLRKKVIQIKGPSFFSYFVYSINFFINILPHSVILSIIVILYKINLVDINSSINAGLAGIIAAKITRRPCICHLHDTRNITRQEKFFGEWVTKFIVLTDAALALYRIALNSNNIEVIYNGVDLNNYNIFLKNGFDFKEEFNIYGNNPIVGMVGRITAGKGHDDFIKAAQIINKIKPDAKFIIVGCSAPDEQKLEQKLKENVRLLGLTTSFIFTGWREDALDIMAAFDVLVFPSSFPEGFGLSCIEAMALYKPVVATNIPGPSEIVVDGVTGIIVPPTNPERLAEAILKLLNDGELARSLGQAGRKRVEEHFDIRRVTKQIESLYLEVLNKGN